MKAETESGRIGESANRRLPVSPSPRLSGSALLSAAAACDRAAAAQSPEEEMRAVMQIMAHREQIRLALLQTNLNRVAASHRHQERRPMAVEGEGDFARVEARVPKELFFHLVQQKNFGWDGFCDDGGMRDFLKTYPQCRAVTKSGKTVVGFRKETEKRRDGETGKAPTRRFTVSPTRRFHFERGTLNLAT